MNNLRKLAMHGAVAALIGASAVLAVSPASARLVCNQYGNCYWTHNPGDYVPSRYQNHQYENQWGVRIQGSRHNDWNSRGDRDWDRDHDRYYNNYDRDRDYDNNDRY
jgi:hypothetical protein